VHGKKTNMRKCINLGDISISNEDILDLEVSVNDWTILCMKVVHAIYHTFSDLQLEWPSNLHRNKLEMWANAQRDGRPAEYRWRPLFNAS